MTLPPAPARTPRRTLAVPAAAAALLLLVLAAPAQAGLVMGGPGGGTIIFDPPVVVGPDVVGIVGRVVADIVADVHVRPCADGSGESVDYAGDGVEACLVSGPDSTCLRVRTFTPGGDVAREHACSDRDAYGNPCASAYHEGILVADDRTCAGSYPDGPLCVAHSAMAALVEDRACVTSDEHGNPCVADTAYLGGAPVATVRTCAGGYPVDGFCSATRATTLGVTPEARTCLGSDAYGNPCVAEVLYLDGAYVASDAVCVGPHGSDGLCVSDKADVGDRQADADVRLCHVEDGGDPCVQAVVFTSGPAEQLRDRACVRPDGAGPGEPCVSNHVLVQATPATDQWVCLDQTPEGATCVHAWMDRHTVLPGHTPAWICTYGSDVGQCVSVQSSGAPEAACVGTSPERGGCVLVTAGGATRTACGDDVTGGDDDRDSVPDTGEEVLCGSQAAEDLFDRPEVPGSCDGPSDYEPEDLQPVVDAVEDARELVVATVFGLAAEAQRIADGAVAFVLATVGPVVDEAKRQADAAVAEALRQAGEVQEAVDALDLDDDGVPDTAEPTLCQVENRNFAFDGTCDAGRTDYTPPGA